MPTKAQEKTIQEYEAEALRARSALLRAEAEAEELTEQLEDLETQRAAVSVKKLGSRTEAVKRFEQLDRQETKLKRDITLTRASISELEEALKEAEDALAEAVAAEEDARVEAKVAAYHQAAIEFEDALDRLAEARLGVFEAHRQHQAALREAGHNPP